MMYALGDMDGVICLAGALCKTWALLFTGEFGLVILIKHLINANYPRARGSLSCPSPETQPVNKLPTCAGEFGGSVRIYPKVVMTYPRVQRSLVVRVFLVCS